MLWYVRSREPGESAWKPPSHGVYHSAIRTGLSLPGSITSSLSAPLKTATASLGSVTEVEYQRGKSRFGPSLKVGFQPFAALKLWISVRLSAR